MKKNEKFLEKQNNFPIVPWNYFLDKITTVFCPYSFVYKNNVDFLFLYLFYFIENKEFGN